MLKKSLLVILEVAIITGISVLGFGFDYLPEVGSPQEARADTADTSASVNNNAPTLSAVVENPASATSSPTNVGSSVTFEGTGDDPNGDDYYLAICKTDAISTSSQAAPTCDGGAWCVSSTTTDNTQASCSTTTQDGWSETEDWYAFVCDYSTDSKCSASSQGTGAADANSPFHVNHRPSFTTITTGESADPSGSISVTTTASDPDSEGSDTVSLYVCDSGGFTAGTGCDGNTFCSSTDQASNPTCNFNVDASWMSGYEANDVVNDGTYNYYGYVDDNHDFAATGTPHGSSKDYTVNNVAPVVGTVHFNSDGSITITADSSSLIHATTSVTDSNGCNSDAELSTSTSTFYQDDKVTSACSANENDCYTSITCSLGSCSVGTWSNVDCTSTMYYNANPTDTGNYATNQGWNSDIWTALVTVTDDDGLTDSASSSQEMTTTAGLDVTETSIDYYGGAGLDPGSNTGSTNSTTTVETVGNTPIDSNISAQTTLTSGSDTISTSSQKYGTSSVAYSSLSYNASSSPVKLVLQSGATTDHNNPTTDEVYWGLAIPENQPSGDYSGVNLFSAVERTY